MNEAKLVVDSMDYRCLVLLLVNVVEETVKWSSTHGPPCLVQLGGASSSKAFDYANYQQTWNSPLSMHNIMACILNHTSYLSTLNNTPYLFFWESGEGT